MSCVFRRYEVQIEAPSKLEKARLSPGQQSRYVDFALLGWCPVVLTTGGA